MKLLQVLAVSSCALFPQAAVAANDEIETFFKTCMASVPKFSEIGDLTSKLGFVGNGEKSWIRADDGLDISLLESENRYVCATSKTGNHFERLRGDTERVLTSRFLGSFEKKEFQGRLIHLVKALDESVILEIVPPYGASTMVFAVTRKK